MSTHCVDRPHPINLTLSTSSPRTLTTQPYYHDTLIIAAMSQTSCRAYNYENICHTAPGCRSDLHQDVTPPRTQMSHHPTTRCCTTRTRMSQRPAPGCHITPQPGVALPAPGCRTTCTRMSHHPATRRCTIWHQDVAPPRTRMSHHPITRCRIIPKIVEISLAERRSSKSDSTCSVHSFQSYFSHDHQISHNLLVSVRKGMLHVKTPLLQQKLSHSSDHQISHNLLVSVSKGMLHVKTPLLQQKLSHSSDHQMSHNLLVSVSKGMLHVKTPLLQQKLSYASEIS